MPEQHHALGQALGTGGTHVVLADFFQEQGAIEARLRPQPRHNGHQHRQRQELDCVQPAGEARERHQPQQLREDPLARDDVEQAGNGQQQHAEHDAPEIEPRGPEIHERQGKDDADEEPEDKGGHRQGQAGPHARLDLAADVAAAVGGAEVHGQQRHGTLIEHRVGQPGGALRLAIEEQRLVVAALGLPFFHRFLADALAADRQPRHVIGRVHREEQDEGEEVHAEQDQHAVQQPADHVADHD
ncbi:hypothetical protein D9M69_545810 [compost metagenome]